ncbi:MAG TPA: YibE/F family protein [Candidatus Limnocylindria bacterium]|nr:YibE/F family protein [Candidatus Limnocylindria bacterium]
MRALLTLLLVLVATACGNAYESRSGDVFDAHVTRVVSTTEQTTPDGLRQLTQRVEIELDGSLYRGDRVEVGWGGRVPITRNGLLRPGDQVLVSQRRAEDGTREYAIEDVVRLPSLLPVAAAALIALLAVGRLKGLASIAGLAVSVAAFLLAVLPAIQRGDDPLLATLIGSALILAATVYLVHGLNRKSTAALAGTTVGLVVVAGLGWLGIALSRITGLGDEESVFLAVGTGFSIDMTKLVLAGIIVASLGALADMAVGQASTTFELAAVDRSLRGRALYSSALNVGRDHVGSLVNTLALAYFGGALPLVLLLSLGNSPLVVALNGETIAISLLGVLAATCGLVIAVPVTTAAAVALVRSR